VAISSDYLTALAGVNASALIAVAVEWRAAVAAARKRTHRAEGRKAARLTIVFAASSCVMALIALGFNNWSMDVGWILMVPTVGALAALYLVFFPDDAARANKWLDSRNRRFWVIAWVIGALIATAIFWVGLESSVTTS
jgi:cell division protein FtsW (lipid II flippase)